MEIEDDKPLTSPDDDDPVEREVNVFLAKDLASKLYVLQYPLRPSYRPLETPSAARLKPKHQIVELEFDVDVEDEHYDDDVEPPKRITKHKLESKRVSPLTQYAVGLMRNGEMHLTPVEAVLQMRPTLTHLNQANEEGLEDFLEEEEEATKEEKPEIKQLQVVYKKKQSEKALAAKRNSYAYKKELVEGEPWTELAVGSTEEVETVFELMICEDDRTIPFKVPPQSYLSTFGVTGADSQPVKEEEEEKDGQGANLEGKVRQPEPRPKAEKKVPLSSASSSRGASSSAQATVKKS